MEGGVRRRGKDEDRGRASHLDLRPRAETAVPAATNKLSDSDYDKEMEGFEDPDADKWRSVLVCLDVWLVPFILAIVCAVLLVPNLIKGYNLASVDTGAPRSLETASP
ncbi:hypothetical protein T484DRAFT_1932315 [Baffinella frigidus]|nr:hypothetical protein T484DRAFT_1932315 [Cryptophyta sp. CCMP2293]|mmetsp:Transcript_25999/g.59972  ORF Transcript_25999/g.59972 Transcript_25999/m.59972 type:complete len:108 (-) Transcript_25999:9-332(-)